MCAALCVFSFVEQKQITWFAFILLFSAEWATVGCGEGDIGQPGSDGETAKFGGWILQKARGWRGQSDHNQQGECYPHPTKPSGTQPGCSTTWCQVISRFFNVAPLVAWCLGFRYHLTLHVKMWVVLRRVFHAVCTLVIRKLLTQKCLLLQNNAENLLDMLDKMKVQLSSQITANSTQVNTKIVSLSSTFCCTFQLIDIKAWKPIFQLCESLEKSKASTTDYLSRAATNNSDFAGQVNDAKVQQLKQIESHAQNLQSENTQVCAAHQSCNMRLPLFFVCHLTIVLVCRATHKSCNNSEKAPIFHQVTTTIDDLIVKHKALRDEVSTFSVETQTVCFLSVSCWSVTLRIVQFTRKTCEKYRLCFRSVVARAMVLSNCSAMWNLSSSWRCRLIWLARRSVVCVCVCVCVCVLRKFLEIKLQKMSLTDPSVVFFRIWSRNTRTALLLSRKLSPTSILSWHLIWNKNATALLKDERRWPIGLPCSVVTLRSGTKMLKISLRRNSRKTCQQVCFSFSFVEVSSGVNLAWSTIYRWLT